MDGSKASAKRQILTDIDPPEERWAATSTKNHSKGTKRANAPGIKNLARNPCSVHMKNFGSAK